jgi:hypothetical protein
MSLDYQLSRPQDQLVCLVRGNVKNMMFFNVFGYIFQGHRTSLAWSGLVEGNVKKIVMFFEIFGLFIFVVPGDHQPSFGLPLLQEVSPITFNFSCHRLPTHNFWQIPYC